MKSFYLFFFFFLCAAATVRAQVGIGTMKPDPSAALDVSSDTKGFLVPRISLTDVQSSAPIAGVPANGLIVFNTSANVIGGEGIGLYYWNALDKKWVFLGNGFKGVKNQSAKVEKSGFISLLDKDNNTLDAIENSVLEKFTIGINETLFRGQVGDIILDSLATGQVRDSLLNIVTKNGAVLEAILKNVGDKSANVEKKDFISFYDKDDKELAAAENSAFRYFKIGVDNTKFRNEVGGVILDSLATGQVRDSLLNIVTKNGAVLETILKNVGDKSANVEKKDFISFYDKDDKELAMAENSAFRYFKIGVDNKKFRNEVGGVILDSLAAGQVRDSLLNIVTKNGTVLETILKNVGDKSANVEKKDFISFYDKDDKELAMAENSAFRFFKIGVDNKKFRTNVSSVVLDSLQSGTALRDSVVKVVASNVGQNPIRENVVKIAQEVMNAANKLPKVMLVNDADYTIKPEDYIVVVQNMKANRTITLPVADATSTGRVLIINQFTPDFELNFDKDIYYSDNVKRKKIISSLGGGDTGGAYKVMLVSDGGRWLVIGNNF